MGQLVATQFEAHRRSLLRLIAREAPARLARALEQVE
jgi:hypothetical protein